MYSVPSNDPLLLHVTSLYGGSSSHRLKHLQKSDRRAPLLTCFCLWMEVFNPCNTSVCLDISCSTGPSLDQYYLTQYNSKNLSMNDLKTCLDEFLNIGDTGTSSSGLNLPTAENVCNVVTEYEIKGSEKNAISNSTSGKFFSKCGTYTPLHGPKTSGDVFIGEKGKHEEDICAEVSEINGFSKSFNKCYSRSISLPAPLKLVSAIKGSREKQGIPTKKQSLTWAPDVYDPIPTSMSHVPSNKTQSYRSNGKKSGKYKQKGRGKSSRGSKAKDKKQVQKNGGGSTKLKPFHEGNGVSLGEHQVGSVDFDVGSPDPICGSSFLKKSATKLHFPVAEAT